jgi:signal transduction histidine kinase/pSer/pThr/pTyr-binding forkhead associated (FHA) protein
MKTKSRGMESHLILKIDSGPLQGQRYKCEDEIVIGRISEAEIFLPDIKVSRRHARVFRDPDNYFIVDLNSQNGTYLNGKIINSPNPLKNKDNIKIGDTDILVEVKAATIDINDENAGEDFEPLISKKITDVSIYGMRETEMNRFFHAFDIPQTEASKLLKNARDFAILYDIARTLQKNLDLNCLLKLLIESILKEIRADIGQILLPDDESGEYIVAVEKKIKTGHGKHDASQSVSRTILRWIIENKSAMISHDVSEDFRLKASKSVFGMNIRSVMAVPSISGEKIVGVIQLVNYGINYGFNEDDLDLLIVIASLMAIAVENAKLYREQTETITKLKKAQEELLATQNELVKSEQMALIGKLSAGIIHEIKNLLGPVIMGDLLLEKYGEEHLIKEHVNLLHESYSKIINLLQEMRKYATGEIESCRKEYASMNKLVDDVMNFLRFDTIVKRAKIIKKYEQDIEMLFDVEKVRQVLINVIRNSAQALHESGGQIIIDLYRKNTDVFVEIGDTGKGIPHDNLKRIWEPFFSTKGSVGIGLYISKKIIEQCGGEIQCLSEERIGTTMIIRLPYEVPAG